MKYESCEVSYIYYLKSQSEPDVIRYVGQSVDPINRFKQHIKDCFNGNTFKDAWIANLINTLTPPNMEVVSCCSVDYVNKLELSFIKEHEDTLVNTTGVKRNRVKGLKALQEKTDYDCVYWHSKDDVYKVFINKKYISSSKNIKEAVLYRDQAAKFLGIPTIKFHDCEKKSPKEIQEYKLANKGYQAKKKHSQYRGVSYNFKEGKFISSIFLSKEDKNATYISSFEEEISASIWYDNVAAYLGKPTSGNETNPCSLERAKILIHRERHNYLKGVSKKRKTYKVKFKVYKGFADLVLSGIKTEELAVKYYDGLSRFYNKDYTNYDGTYSISVSEAIKEIRGDYPTKAKLLYHGVPNIEESETYIEDSSVSYLGVSAHKNRGTYDAVIMLPEFPGKRIELGAHKTPEAAAKTYDRVASYYHMEVNGFDVDPCSLEEIKLIKTREDYKNSRYVTSKYGNYQIGICIKKNKRALLGGIETKEEAIKLVDAMCRYYGLDYTNYDGEEKISYEEAYEKVKGQKPTKEILSRYGLIDEVIKLSKKEEIRKTTGNVGLTFNKKIKKWTAVLYLEGVRSTLGSYVDKDVAQETYDAVVEGKLTINEALYRAAYLKKGGHIGILKRGKSYYVNIGYKNSKGEKTKYTSPPCKDFNKVLHASIALRNYLNMPTDLRITKEKMSPGEVTNRLSKITA